MVPTVPAVPSVVPDSTPRRHPPAVGSSGLAPVGDLDGIYLWLGPVGAGARAGAAWDSSFGAAATLVRVREGEALAALGASLGASRWTARDGGRLWLDAIAGTRRIGGWMLGVSAGPLVELAALAHPRIGGSVGVWAFLGVTPFVRAGSVAEGGTFVEAGLHFALPVLRRR